MGFELAGVSWSEFAAGTLRAHFGHNWADFGPFEGISSEGSNRLKVPWGGPSGGVPGEGLEPSRGKPSQDFKSWEWDFQVPEK